MSEETEPKAKAKSKGKTRQPRPKAPKRGQKVKVTNLEKWQARQGEKLAMSEVSAKTGLELHRSSDETRDFLAALIARLGRTPPFSYLQDTFRRVSPNGGKAKPGDSLLGDLAGYLAGLYVENQQAAQAAAMYYAATRAQRGAPEGEGSPAEEAPVEVPPKDYVEAMLSRQITDAEYGNWLRGNGYLVPAE